MLNSGLRSALILHSTEYSWGIYKVTGLGGHSGLLGDPGDQTRKANMNSEQPLGDYPPPGHLQG